MPKASYKSMSACLADYKGVKDAAAMCKGKVKGKGPKKLNPQVPSQPDMKMKKGGSSY